MVPTACPKGYRWPSGPVITMVTRGMHPVASVIRSAQFTTDGVGLMRKLSVGVAVLVLVLMGCSSTADTGQTASVEAAPASSSETVSAKATSSASEGPATEAVPSTSAPVSTSIIDEDSAALDDLCDTYCDKFDNVSEQGDCDPTGDDCIDMVTAARENLSLLKDDLDTQRILPPERLDSSIEALDKLVQELRENHLTCVFSHEPVVLANDNCGSVFSGIADAAGDLSVALEKDR